MAVRHISVGTAGSLTHTVKSSSSQNNYLTVSTFTCRKKPNPTCLLAPCERVTEEAHARARPKGGSVEFYNGAGGRAEICSSNSNSRSVLRLFVLRNRTDVTQRVTFLTFKTLQDATNAHFKKCSSANKSRADLRSFKNKLALRVSARARLIFSYRVEGPVSKGPS